MVSGKPNSPYKIELIEWIDHASLEGGNWRDWDDLESLKLAHIYSVGWVVRETDSEVVVICHKDDDVFWGEIIIHKPSIVRRLTLLDDGKKNETDRVQTDLHTPSQLKRAGRTRAKPKRKGR